MPLSKQETEWNYYTSGYEARTQERRQDYIHIPQDFTQVKNFQTKTKKVSAKNIPLRGKLIILALLLIHIFYVAPMFIRTVTKPILFAIKNNSKVKVSNYNYLLKPTTKYLYNTNFLNTKLLIGTNKKPLMTPLVMTKELTSLKNSLLTEIRAYDNLDVAIFVWDTSNGKYVDINADKPYSAASMIKIPVLVSLFKAIEAGKLKLQDTMQLEEPYISSGSGSLQYRMQAQDLTYDKLARLMITNSDNTATNMIMSAIGSMTAVNDDVKSWGLKNTYIKTWLPDLLGTNYTTPKDLATMLSNLDNEKFLTTESRAYIFDYMGHVKNNRLLAAGIPAGASIAHKTGDIASMLGDAGIIYTPNGRKYIVSIMVKRPHNSHSAKEFIVKASQTIYNYMSTY